MSRYHELCMLAANYSKQFDEHENECRRLAEEIIQEYAAYLSCPLQKVEQVELNRSLKPTENAAPLTQKLRVRTDPEGFVHFAWHLTFQASYRYGAIELITFGLRITGEGATIREERDFAVEVQNRETWEPFFNYLYRQSLEGFSVPYGERRTRIGFLLPNDA